MGLPAGPKDVAFTMVEGKKIKDDRYATLRYRKQLARTMKETDGKLQAQAESRMSKSTVGKVANPALNFVLNKIKNQRQVSPRSRKVLSAYSEIFDGKKS